MELTPTPLQTTHKWLIDEARFETNLVSLVICLCACLSAFLPACPATYQTVYLFFYLYGGQMIHGSFLQLNGRLNS